MKIIAIQGGDRFLIDIEDGFGGARIADKEYNEIYPVTSVDSILKHGYWEDYDHDEELMQELLKLPEASMES